MADARAATVTQLKVAGYVYMLKGDGGFYKIGKSKSPKSRHAAFATLPYNVELLHQVATNSPQWLESLMHQRFSDKRVAGEWFLLSEEDVKWFCGHSIFNYQDGLLSSKGRPSKSRDGYHTLFAWIPEVIWKAVDSEAIEKESSMAKVVALVLAKHYGVDPQSLPRPKRAGRKPRKNG